MLGNQNSSEQLDFLAAQRRLYSDAKRVDFLRMLLVGPGALFCGLIALRWPGARPYVALYAIAAITADNLWLVPWAMDLRRTAARIQELFDCNVLDLDWNALKAGSQPELEVIAHAARRYWRAQPDPTALNNWYPHRLSCLPIDASRIACQRINCWWDLALRKKFKRILVTSAVVLTFLLLLIGLIGGLTVEKLFLLVVAPAAPMWNLVARRLREDSESGSTAARLKENADRLWSAACSSVSQNGSLPILSRQLQDEIFAHRCRASLVPDFFYDLYRGGQESQMADSAEHLINEFQKKRVPASKTT